MSPLSSELRSESGKKASVVNDASIFRVRDNVMQENFGGECPLYLQG
jgi:hypothetical protein